MIALVLATLLSTPPSVPPSRTDYLRAEETLPPLMLGAALDLWSTGYRLRESPGEVREGNPFAQSTEEHVAMQLAWVAAAVFVVHYVDRRWGRHWGVRVLIAAVSLKVYAFAHNLRAGM